MPCKLILKDGSSIQVDMSSTRLKHLRRNKVSLPMEAEDGSKVLLDTTQILKVIPH